MPEYVAIHIQDTVHLYIQITIPAVLLRDVRLTLGLHNVMITSGKISPREALVVFSVLCLLAFVLVLTLNRTTILLSVGGVVLAATYPFMKRYHDLPQVHLGAAFGWSIPMAFAAQLDPGQQRGVLGVREPSESEHRGDRHDA